MLVAWFFAAVLLGLARFAAAEGRLAAAAHDRARAADLARTAGLVLRGELRYAAQEDFSTAPDSVRLRAVRGSGVICGRTGSVIRVRYRGIRRPDPEKDSALVMTDSATDGVAFSVVAVAGKGANGACGDGYRLTLDGVPPDRGLVLVYETGSYHLTGGALRYRRGSGGRQPVTETILAGGEFHRSAGRLAARMDLDVDSLPRAAAAGITAGTGLMNPGPP